MTSLLDDLRRVSATSEDLLGALAHATPMSTDDVAGVLEVARAHGVGVTVRGGGTGGLDPQGTVLLSTTRLDRIGPVDAGTLSAGAGVPLVEARLRAQRHRWDLAVDAATDPAATLGGAAATGWDAVLGVRAVLLDGTVLDRLADPLDEDVRRVLSAGGVITAVRVQLEPMVYLPE